MNKMSATILIASLLAVALAGCSGAPSSEQADEQAAVETPAMDPADAVVTDEYGSRVTMQVTKDGFVPAAFTVPVGKPVTISITRHVEKTCATEIVIKDFDIKQDLPIETTVEFTFRPTKPGEYRYACGMDMIAGTMTVAEATEAQ